MDETNIRRTIQDPGRAVPHSPAEQEWRAALTAAGYRVAPTVIPVHVSELLNPQGNKQRAEAAYRAFLESEPDNLMALEGLAFLLQHRGEVEERIEIRRRAFRAEARQMGVPDEALDSTQDFFAACLGNGPPPLTPPLAYLEKAFDACAAYYDTRMLEVQQYRGPDLVRAAVLKATESEPNSLRIFDAGCGTGLVGESLRKFCRTLAGADLSAGMLQHARARGVYDALHRADYAEVLKHANASFDVIVALELLSYVGDPQPLFAAAAQALVPDGILVATTEPTDTAGIKLLGHRRFQHQRDYVISQANAAGLTMQNCETAVLRLEIGSPLDCDLFVLKR